MANLMQAGQVALDEKFLAPVTVAAVTAAVAVMNENHETPGHDQRVSLASSVLQDPGAFARRMRWAVVTNGTVVDKWVSADIEGALGDVQFVVNSVWDAMAGYAAG